MFYCLNEDCCKLLDSEVIAIDGKTVRGSYDKAKDKKEIHMVNAFSTENGVSLGQEKLFQK